MENPPCPIVATFGKLQKHSEKHYKGVFALYYKSPEVI